MRWVTVSKSSQPVLPACQCAATSFMCLNRLETTARRCEALRANGFHMAGPCPSTGSTGTGCAAAHSRDLHRRRLHLVSSLQLYFAGLEPLKNTAKDSSEETPASTGNWTPGIWMWVCGTGLLAVGQHCSSLSRPRPTRVAASTIQYTVPQRSAEARPS